MPFAVSMFDIVVYQSERKSCNSASLVSAVITIDRTYTVNIWQLLVDHLVDLDLRSV